MAAGPYRLYLRDWSHKIIARHDFAAPDDATAMSLVSTLCDACKDVCEEFHLWQGRRFVGSGAHAKFAESDSEFIRLSQRLVVDFWIAYRDAAISVQESRLLLEKITQWESQSPTPWVSA